MSVVVFVEFIPLYTVVKGAMLLVMLVVECRVGG